MFQQESIYNLVPSKPILPTHQKMYRSMYPHWIAPTASTFILSNTSYPGVANTGGSLKFPRGAHPISANYRSMGLPKGGYKINPEKFIRKNHQYKILPAPERIKSASEIRKPAVVTIKDKPIMGLKSQKNYITSNAMDVILMEPKKRKIPNDGDLDYYMNKKDYGKIPKYIQKRREDAENEIINNLEVERQNMMYERSKRKEIDNDELLQLREGLEKKLKELRYEYGKISHRRKFDTLVTKNYKEKLEKEIEQVEKDLELLKMDKVVVDMTK